MISPLGQSVQVDKVYQRIPLEIQSVIFFANLMELPFGEFDLILGTDWLVKHRASLNCGSKWVILRTDKNCEILKIRERQDFLSNVISALVAKKLVRKGCKVYLAFVSDSTFIKFIVKEIQTVKDFPNVFPKELPGVPPDKEVGFDIDLLSGTNPVSITPY